MYLQHPGMRAGLLNNASQISDVVSQSINSLVTSIVARLPYLIAGILVLLIFWLAGSLAKKIFISASRRTRLDERLRILFSRLIAVIIFILGLFTALTVIVPSFAFGDFIAGLGLTSLAIGFATKDILNHLISGVAILWHQPFRIGDYIILKDEEGKVDYIGVRATSLKRANGEVILIPNGDIYSAPFRVRRAGASYPMSLTVAVGYDTDLGAAKQLITDILEKSEYVVEEPAPSVSIGQLTSEGVRLTANFRTNSTENRPNVAYDSVATSIINEFTKANISIFPPTEMLSREAPPAVRIGKKDLDGKTLPGERIQ